MSPVYKTSEAGRSDAGIDARHIRRLVASDRHEEFGGELRMPSRDIAGIESEDGKGAQDREYLCRVMQLMGQGRERFQIPAHDEEQVGVLRFARDEPEEKPGNPARSLARSN